MGARKTDYHRTIAADRLYGNNFKKAFAGTSDCEEKIATRQKAYLLTGFISRKQYTVFAYMTSVFQHVFQILIDIFQHNKSK